MRDITIEIMVELNKKHGNIFRKNYISIKSDVHPETSIDVENDNMNPNRTDASLGHVGRIPQKEYRFLTILPLGQQRVNNTTAINIHGVHQSRGSYQKDL